MIGCLRSVHGRLSTQPLDDNAYARRGSDLPADECHQCLAPVVTCVSRRRKPPWRIPRIPRSVTSRTGRSRWRSSPQAPTSRPGESVQRRRRRVLAFRRCRPVAPAVLPARTRSPLPGRPSASHLERCAVDSRVRGVHLIAASWICHCAYARASRPQTARENVRAHDEHPCREQQHHPE